MALMLMILRKMFNNRWLVGSWLLGLVITVALVSSIPIYTAGVLERLLIQNLQNYQVKNNNYPASLYNEMSLRDVPAATPNPTKDLQLLNSTQQYFFQNLQKEVRLPVLTDVTILGSISFSLAPQDTAKYNPSDTAQLYVNISALSHLSKHIKLLAGRMPSKKPVNGVYETLVTPTAMAKYHMFLNEVFILHVPSSFFATTTTTSTVNPATEKILVKPVGEFDQKSNRDLYWRMPASSYNSSFIMPYSTFKQVMVGGKFGWFSSLQQYAAFNYNKLHFENITSIAGLQYQLQTFDSGYKKSTSSYTYLTRYPLQNILYQYISKQHQMTAMLWTLNVPVLIMLAFYLFMVSRLIIEREKTEIAVLRSRGAGLVQILSIYFIEICLLGAIALAIGPLIGWVLSLMLGASNGFLEFVNRQALPVQVSFKSYQYGFLSLAVSIFMVMIPVYLAARQSIVSHKQQIAREIGSAFWHKYFLDVILLLISWYGWYDIGRNQTEILKAHIDLANGLQLNPLLFFVPALFVLGFGLFCLRIYPWLVRFVYWIGKRMWSPSLYATLVQVGRSSKQYQFLMIFLVMTLAIGIFSASSARTINTNLIDKIRYANGADINLTVPWQNNAQTGSATVVSYGSSSSSSSSSSSTSSSALPFVAAPPVVYLEPPFYPFQHLAGVKHATKVYVNTKESVQGSTKTVISHTTLMGIQPYDFGKTAWFKSSLLPYYWTEYLNLLSKYPTACLISESLAKELGVRVGDRITILGQSNTSAVFTVYAIVNYWPSWDPLPNGTSSHPRTPTLVVANLPYVQTELGLAPYEVWLKLKSNATTAQLYQSMKTSKLYPSSLTNVLQEIRNLKNSAFVLGLNGELTLGFLISMAVTFFGFLLYWILTLSSRRLQYGIFRAMGISLPKLIFMMIWEQLLTSGIACVLGLAVGILTSHLFVPQFQLFFQAGNQVPPFQVIFKQIDEIRLVIFVGAMLLIGLLILGWRLSRIRIHQAVKLGED